MPDGTLDAPEIDSIRAFTVYTTYNPSEGMFAIAETIMEEYSDLTPSDWELVDNFTDYCVIHGTFSCA